MMNEKHPSSGISTDDSIHQDLSWQEKTNLCELWKTSGLSKNLFCKKYNLRLSTFCGWCKRLWSPKQSEGLCQVAMVKSLNKVPIDASKIVIEVDFPNQISARINLQEHQVLCLLQGLIHAATTSW